MGRLGENLVINYLTLAGIEVKPNENLETRSQYDLECKLGNKKLKIEVKLDWLSCKTNRLAIEYENTKTGQPSGISITTAELWALVVKDETNWVVFFCKTERLREYIKNNKARVFIGAGDGNANLLLFPIAEILTIFKRIDNVDAKLIPNILKGLLK